MILKFYYNFKIHPDLLSDCNIKKINTLKDQDQTFKKNTLND